MTGSSTPSGGLGRVANIGPGGTPVGWAAAEAGSFVFKHEIGHIFGCRHNRPRDNTGPFEHGYLIPGTRARTILA